MASNTTSDPQGTLGRVQLPPQSPVQAEAFTYYPAREDSAETPSHQNGQSAESASAGNGALSYPSMSVFPYGNVVPPPPMMSRPKRTQCKNACTNCQKACKKCDDNRPCQRCVRYGTSDTCVDSQRKERKKGVKRGPYKKRDGKVDADNGDTNRVPQAVQGAPLNMPYVGPVGYPPGMWSTYTPTGHGGKLEATGFYQPVFALTPVGGPPSHGGDGGSASGGNESPHFPVGFYPATFISYPGPFQPYPIPQVPGSVPQGFHFAYPPPLFAQRPSQVANANSDQNANNNPSANVLVKENTSATLTGSGRDKDVDSQVNSQVKVVPSQDNRDAPGREAD